jgi:hypothetical protein
MIYSEQQLERFSKPPFKYEKAQVITTHTEIRTAISTFYNGQNVKDTFNLHALPDLDIFLQGSYANDTNVTKSSDVDIVVRFKGVWRADLSHIGNDDKVRYQASVKNSEYSFPQFKTDIEACLQRHFGYANIKNDNKCLRLREHARFCDADIIPVFTYKLYGSYPSDEAQRFREGVYFDTNGGVQIINYPKQHADALAVKSRSTNGNFKETVRMFKNLRNELEEKRLITTEAAKSYYIENLLYNVPDALFAGAYRDRFVNILNHIIVDYNSTVVNNYGCANGVHRLFSDHTWKIELLNQYLKGLALIANQNEY